MVKAGCRQVSVGCGESRRAWQGGVGVARIGVAWIKEAVDELTTKYAAKLEAAGLAEPGGALVGLLDAELCWNRSDPFIQTLETVFAGLSSVNSLAFARPAEPFATVLDHVCAGIAATGTITPEDCETVTFLHDLPVVAAANPEWIVQALKRRKSVIVKGVGVIGKGSVSPEQAYIHVSSTLFAALVKFFADYPELLRSGRASEADRAAFSKASGLLNSPRTTPPALVRGPFADRAAIEAAMIQAGAAVVDYGLVDSFFGNLSYFDRDVLYISQTGSSLDELAGRIDPCPLDGSSTAALTASSELKAHLAVVEKTGMRAVLHGHPLFAVILSLDCEEDCRDANGDRSVCRTRCPRPRSAAGVPITPGEVGTGPYGLCTAMPKAMVGNPGVIVYGHGLFTVGAVDYTDAFASLLGIENRCRELYFERIKRLGG